MKVWQNWQIEGICQLVNYFYIVRYWMYSKFAKLSLKDNSPNSKLLSFTLLFCYSGGWLMGDGSLQQSGWSIREFHGNQRYWVRYVRVCTSMVHANRHSVYQNTWIMFPRSSLMYICDRNQASTHIQLSDFDKL